MICCAGKNASTMPRVVVTKPLPPARNNVVLAVQPFARSRIRGDFQQRAKHIKKRDQLQHHRQRQQALKCFLHARPAKAIQTTKIMETTP